jgi:hypothetical protein
MESTTRDNEVVSIIKHNCAGPCSSVGGGFDEEDCLRIIAKYRKEIIETERRRIADDLAALWDLGEEIELDDLIAVVDYDEE